MDYATIVTFYTNLSIFYNMISKVCPEEAAVTLLKKGGDIYDNRFTINIFDFINNIFAHKKITAHFQIRQLFI